MGKVLVLCDGEDRWEKRHIVRHLINVNGEPLLSRTIRQVRKLMNNFPHIVSHQKCLRPLSTNFVVPSARRWMCETILSIKPIWGKDWTMILLGDVYYTDQFIDLVYKQRDKFKFHFYGNGQDIFAMSFVDNDSVEESLSDVVEDADFNYGAGKLWNLYYRLSNKPLPSAGMGYTGDLDDLHYTYVIDDSCDFDTIEDYKKWRKKHG